MIIVTGGAGFIGSALIYKLNTQGIRDIVVVDRLGKSEKWRNLVNLRFAEYLEAEDFYPRLEGAGAETLFSGLQGIFHFGACSSTTETDASFLIRNNFNCSQRIARFAQRVGCRFIYASSAATYGDGERGYDDDHGQSAALKPLNMYGYSKQVFDQWVLHHAGPINFVGVKFFNVFGPNEYHKGDMRSLVHKAVPQVLKEGKIRLFKSHKPGFADGEQLRDFIYVKDAVEACFFLLDQPGTGLVNLGTGLARSFKDLAIAVFKALGKEPRLEYFPMPESLQPKYQYHTCASIDKLRQMGFNQRFQTLEESVRDYVQNYITRSDPYLGNDSTPV